MFVLRLYFLIIKDKLSKLVMSVFLSFPGKIILTNKILIYCSHRLVEMASWKPEDIELSP